MSNGHRPRRGGEEAASGGPSGLRADRRFGAAVLKLSFELRGELAAPAFRFVYRGVLKDRGLSAREVDLFIREHREELERLCGERGLGGGGGAR